MKVSGYEIHVGVSVSRGGAIEAVKSLRTNRGVGYLDSTGRVFGTYMHDLFKNEELTDRVVNNLARMKGIERLVEPVPFSQDAEFDKLAAYLRRHIDFAAVYESMSLSAPSFATPSCSASPVARLRVAQPRADPYDMPTPIQRVATVWRTDWGTVIAFVWGTVWG